MIGCYSGVIAKITEVINKDLLIIHNALFSGKIYLPKKLSPELNDFMNGAMKIANDICGRALHSMLFEALCDSISSHYHHLLFHAEVRWLSRGRVLTRLFELREEAKQFFREKNSPLKELWIDELAYLADIFNCLNNFNSSLQINHINIFTLNNKSGAFRNKLVF